MAANGNGNTKINTTGMMPDASIGGRVVSQIIKRTGLGKHLVKMATAVIAPLGLLTLCMLPSIVKALSMLANVALVAAAIYFGFRILGTRNGAGKGATTGTEGRFGKSFDFITKEELEERKARAYSPGGYARSEETIATK